jgi:GNAT superfamily N-acetyltransferase
MDDQPRKPEPPLITQEWVLRLEAAEAAYTTAKLEALAAAEGNARGVEIAHVGGSILLSIASRSSNPSVNRAMGLSSEDVTHLDQMLDWLRLRSDYFWVDVAPALADGALLKALARARLYMSFSLNVVYATPTEAQSPLPAEICVQEIDLNSQTRGFALALSEGFGIPLDLLESTEQTARIEHGAPGWQTYLAVVDGQPAAMATLYVDHHTGIASIDAMATRPDFRRRGCQSALLRRCLADATRAGCSLVVSQTRPSSASERNMVRAGFGIAYTKLLYAPLDPGAHN